MADATLYKKVHLLAYHILTPPHCKSTLSPNLIISNSVSFQSKQDT